MNEVDALMLLAEMDLAWPDRGVPATDEDAVRVWAAWLSPFSLDEARKSMRVFGGQQARPPSLAQILQECRAITGETLPTADEVLAEFRHVVRLHSTQGVIDPAWFSTPEIGAFAASGAFEEWGQGSDPGYDPEHAGAAAAQLASMRRRWDAFAQRVERSGLRAACERLHLGERVMAQVCPPEPLGIGDGR